MDVVTILKKCSPISTSPARNRVCDIKTKTGCQMSIAMLALHSVGNELKTNYERKNPKKKARGIGILSIHSNNACCGYEGNFSGLSKYLKQFEDKLSETRIKTIKTYCATNSDVGGRILIILNFSHDTLARLVDHKTFTAKERDDIVSSDGGIWFPISKFKVREDLKNCVEDVTVWCFHDEKFPAGKYAVRKDSITPVTATDPPPPPFNQDL